MVKINGIDAIVKTMICSNSNNNQSVMRKRDYNKKALDEKKKNASSLFP
jgi:hypothetical protein